MTQAQLQRLLRYCKKKWNGWGEDIFQEACLIALIRYKSLENVNQKLFSLLCKEGARKLLRHKLYEIPFSQLNGNEEEELEFEDTIIDPRSLEYDAYEAYKACNKFETEKEFVSLIKQPVFTTKHTTNGQQNLFQISNQGVF